MTKTIIYSLVLVAIATATAKAEPLTLMGEYKRHDLRAASLCIEGHIVIIAHSDVGKGGGLNMMQLEHVVDGKILPMTCKVEVVDRKRKSKKR